MHLKLKLLHTTSSSSTLFTKNHRRHPRGSSWIFNSGGNPSCREGSLYCSRVIRLILVNCWAAGGISGHTPYLLSLTAGGWTSWTHPLAAFCCCQIWASNSACFIVWYYRNSKESMQSWAKGPTCKRRQWGFVYHCRRGRCCCHGGGWLELGSHLLCLIIYPWMCNPICMEKLHIIFFLLTSFPIWVIWYAVVCIKLL